MVGLEGRKGADFVPVLTVQIPILLRDTAAARLLSNEGLIRWECIHHEEASQNAKVKQINFGRCALVNQYKCIRATTSLSGQQSIYPRSGFEDRESRNLVPIRSERLDEPRPSLQFEDTTGSD